MRYRILVSGVVQGVFFRAFVKRESERLNLTGFVKNTDNGKVLIEAEGKEGNLKELIKKCNIGSSNSQVEKVDFQIIKEIKDKNFIINY